MEIIIVCLIIATALPILSKGPVAYAQNKMGRYDNKNPRQQQSQLEGFGARALAAHMNAFESLILFAPSVCAALALNQVGSDIQWLSVTYVAARIAYHIFYLTNSDKLRSTVWFIATACPFIILVKCI